MAAGAQTKAKWLAPQIDAMREQVFFGLFQRNGGGSVRRVMAEAMAPTDGLSKKLKRRAGGGPLWISPLQGCYPDARVLLELARPKIAKAGPQSYRSVLPLYIRRAAAEERR
jgi:tRNA A37 threonylcarbamoyladenosine modification protein TsaB